MYQLNHCPFWNFAFNAVGLGANQSLRLRQNVDGCAMDLVFCFFAFDFDSFLFDDFLRLETVHKVRQNR